MSTTFGRISFSRVDGVSIPQGTGQFDQLVSLYGPIDKINIMLETMKYICRSADEGNNKRNFISDSIIVKKNENEAVNTKNENKNKMKNKNNYENENKNNCENDSENMNTIYDNLLIIVNDEGFSGLGGPLTATATITVKIL